MAEVVPSDAAAAVDAPAVLRIADADVLVLTIDPPRGRDATRAAVARALAGRTPVPLSRLYWGHAVEADGVRVAMAHRAPVAAALAARQAAGVAPAVVIAAGIVVADGAAAEGWAATALSWLWPLALIPLLTGVGGWVLAAAGEGRIARLAPAAAARAGADAAQASAMAPFAWPAASGLLARLDAVLPPAATLGAIGMGADGTLEIMVDTPDPAALRAALARDAVLARARTVAQAAVADRGIRLTLRIDRP